MDDFGNLEVWSAVTDAAFEHRKLKRDSDGAFPDVQKLGKRIAEKVAQSAPTASLTKLLDRSGFSAAI